MEAHQGHPRLLRLARGVALFVEDHHLGVAAVAGWIALRRATPAAFAEPTFGEPSIGEPAADEAVPTGLPLGLTGLVLFASGFATLGYEILWFRALRYLVGNSTYALSTVLVVFLLGLGIGALLYRPAVRLLPPCRGPSGGRLGGRPKRRAEGLRTRPQPHALPEPASGL